MKNRVVSDRRALVGFILLAALYVVWPLDLMPGMPIDDLVVAPMLCLLAYAKGTSPAIANSSE